MSQNLILERDSLLEAIELADREASKAQTAKKLAEERIAALQVQMDTQHVRFVFMYSRLEKMGVEIDSLDEDPDERIKLLESEYEESLEENLRLRTLLDESVAEEVSAPATGTALKQVEQSDPEPLDTNALVEIDASLLHAKRSRG